MNNNYNIIFDLGGVVFTWDPDSIIKALIKDKDIQKRVKKHIFNHPDWIKLDTGTLTKQAAIERAVIRSGLAKAVVKKIINSIPSYLIPINETLQLINRIKNHTNHKLFILSNIHIDSIDHLEAKYDFWSIFNGRVISCRIKMVKPELEIYQYILNKYKLIAHNTVFIDDKQINLIPAANLGMQTIKFTEPNYCEKELKRIGFL